MKNLKSLVRLISILTVIVFAFAACDQVASILDDYYNPGDEDDLVLLESLVSGKEFSAVTSFSSTVKEDIFWEWVITREEEVVDPVYGSEKVILEPEVVVDPVYGPEKVLITPEIVVDPVYGEWIEGEYDFDKPLALTSPANTKLNQNNLATNSKTTVALNSGTAKRADIILTKTAAAKFSIAIVPALADNTDSLFENLAIKYNNKDCSIVGGIVTFPNDNGNNNLVITAKEFVFIPAHFEILAEGYTIPAVYEDVLVEEGYTIPAVWDYPILEEGYTIPAVWGYPLLEEGYTIPEEGHWEAGTGLVVTDTTSKVSIGYNTATDKIEISNSAIGLLVFAEATITDDEEGNLTVQFNFADEIKALVSSIACAIGDNANIPAAAFVETENNAAIFEYESGKLVYLGVEIKF